MNMAQCFDGLYVISKSFINSFLTLGLSQQCYSNSGCTGVIVPADNAKDCCVGTNDGQSFGVGPGNCEVPQCIGEIL